MDELLVPIAFFGSIFGILYVYLITRNKERLAMIEKGYELGTNQNREPEKRPYVILRYALLMIGIGIGAFLGWNMQFWFGMNPVFSGIALVFVGGGIGLLISYVIQMRAEKKSAGD